MSRRTYLGKYPDWKPSGSNDYTSTYLRRAELIQSKEKEKEKPCNCGCKDVKKTAEKSESYVLVEQTPSDYVILPKKNEYYMVVENQSRTPPSQYHYHHQRCRPVAPSRSRAYSAYPMTRSYSQTALPANNRIVVETTIEHHNAPPAVTTSYYRPTTPGGYRYVTSAHQPEHYVERVYYPESQNGYYYCEPVVYHN